MRGRTYNPAFMHPDDLAELDLSPGDTVEIRSAYDAVVGIVEADDDLRRGVVSMSHGFGGNPGEAEDPRVDGANTNRLLRTDVDYDPITGMPRMGALPVAVSAVAVSGRGEVGADDRHTPRDRLAQVPRIAHEPWVIADDNQVSGTKEEGTRAVVHVAWIAPEHTGRLRWIVGQGAGHDQVPVVQLRKRVEHGVRILVVVPHAEEESDP